MKLLHKGIVKDHKLVFDNPEAFTVAKTLLEGKRFELTMEKESIRRTTQQNKYMFGVVYKVIADYTGHDVDQIHANMKRLFASTLDEKGLIITEETHRMDTVRMTKYIEDIRRWGAEFLGLDIPDANSVEEL